MSESESESEYEISLDTKIYNNLAWKYKHYVDSHRNEIQEDCKTLSNALNHLVNIDIPQNFEDYFKGKAVHSPQFVLKNNFHPLECGIDVDAIARTLNERIGVDTSACVLYDLGYISGKKQFTIKIRP